MSDYLTALKRAREAELEVQAELEHIERLHRIMRLSERSEEYARSIVEKLAELEKQLNEQIDDAVDSKREALVYLAALSGAERAVLYQYYILAKDWLKISEEMYISERQIYNIRKRALDKLKTRYNKLLGEEQRACGLEEI